MTGKILTIAHVIISSKIHKILLCRCAMFVVHVEANGNQCRQATTVLWLKAREYDDCAFVCSSYYIWTHLFNFLASLDINPKKQSGYVQYPVSCSSNTIILTAISISIVINCIIRRMFCVRSSYCIWKIESKSLACTSTIIYKKLLFMQCRILCSHNKLSVLAGKSMVANQNRSIYPQLLP